MKKGSTAGWVRSPLPEAIVQWIKDQRHPVRVEEIHREFAGRIGRGALWQAVLRMQGRGQLTRVARGLYWIDDTWTWPPAGQG